MNKQNIIITGATSGLGRAAALKLSADHQVIALDSNSTGLKSLTKSIPGLDIYTVDITSPAKVENAITRIVKKYGRLDCLINNAGIWWGGILEETPVDMIKKIIAVNTLGSIFMTRAALPFMKKKNKGLIINIISQNGLIGKKERTVYAASKWAMTGFSKSLSEELAGTNIKITSLFPGQMKTNLFQSTQGKNARHTSTALDPQCVADFISYIVNLPSEVNIPEASIKDQLNDPGAID